MHVQKWMRIKLRRLLPIVATLSLLLTGVMATEVVKAPAARADTTNYNVNLNYPWGGATYVDANYDWGYTTCPTDDTGCMLFTGYKSGVKYGEADPWGYYLRNCTSFVAEKLTSLGVSASAVTGLGNGGDWYNNAPSGERSRTPAAGDAAVVPGTSANPYGHVAYVDSVNSDGTITVEEYNHDGEGDPDIWTGNPADRGFTEFVNFGLNVSGGSSGSGSTSTQSSTIIKLKKTTDSDGTQDVYYATSSDVYQGWWNSTRIGVQRAHLIGIAQNDIVDIDQITQPDGTKSLYTAVPDGVWETYWNPSTNGPQSSKIITGMSGVIKVIATSEMQNGNYTHVLFVLTTSGPYEFWWQDGCNCMNSRPLATIYGSVAFTFSRQADGTDQLYTANAGAVYETYWPPGGSPSTDTIISISQNDITGVNKIIAADGTNEVYTSTPYGVWQSEWGGHVGGLTSSYVVNNFSGSVGVEKRFNPNGSDELYVANGNSIQQYWWNSGGSGGVTLINISQGNIASFDVDYYDGVGQLYTAAGSNIWETDWDSTGIHTSANPIANANP